MSGRRGGEEEGRGKDGGVTNLQCRQGNTDGGGRGALGASGGHLSTHSTQTAKFPTPFPSHTLGCPPPLPDVALREAPLSHFLSNFGNWASQSLPPPSLGCAGCAPAARRRRRPGKDPRFCGGGGGSSRSSSDLLVLLPTILSSSFSSLLLFLPLLPVSPCFTWRLLCWHDLRLNDTDTDTEEAAAAEEEEEEEEELLPRTPGGGTAAPRLPPCRAGPARAKTPA